MPSSVQQRDRSEARCRTEMTESSERRAGHEEPRPYCKGTSQVWASDQRARSGRQINIHIVEESANGVDAWKMAAECAPAIDTQTR